MKESNLLDQNPILIEFSHPPDSYSLSDSYSKNWLVRICFQVRLWMNWTQSIYLCYSFTNTPTLSWELYFYVQKAESLWPQSSLFQLLVLFFQKSRMGPFGGLSFRFCDPNRDWIKNRIKFSNAMTQKTLILIRCLIFSANSS